MRNPERDSIERRLDVGSDPRQMEAERHASSRELYSYDRPRLLGCGDGRPRDRRAAGGNVASLLATALRYRYRPSRSIGQDPLAQVFDEDVSYAHRDGKPSVGLAEAGRQSARSQYLRPSQRGRTSDVRNATESTASSFSDLREAVCLNDSIGN